MAKAKDFKVFILVGHMKYYPWDDKLPLKWAWSRSHGQFNYWAPVLSLE